MYIWVEKAFKLKIFLMWDCGCILLYEDVLHEGFFWLGLWGIKDY